MELKIFDVAYNSSLNTPSKCALRNLEGGHCTSTHTWAHVIYTYEYEPELNTVVLADCGHCPEEFDSTEQLCPTMTEHHLLNGWEAKKKKEER